MSRLRQTESTVYAPATFSGSRVFQASSAACTFCAAVSAVNGGSGGLVSLMTILSLRSASAAPRCSRGRLRTLGDLRRVRSIELDHDVDGKKRPPCNP